MKLINAILAVMLTSGVSAANDIKKPVDALAGTWTVDLTMTAPGQQPIKFKATLACRPAAAGTAVQCALDAEIPGIGGLHEIDVWAWEPETKILHDITVNNLGEVHDHQGSWKDEHTAVFAHTATQGGKPLEEKETVTFRRAGQMDFESTATTADGTTKFTGHARK